MELFEKLLENLTHFNDEAAIIQSGVQLPNQYIQLSNQYIQLSNQYIRLYSQISAQLQLAQVTLQNITTINTPTRQVKLCSLGASVTTANNMVNVNNAANNIADNTADTVGPRPARMNVKLSARLWLPAIHVVSFDLVRADGELYYVTGAGHFAIKILGQLLHGNIGTIYTDEKNPEKIKECKFSDTCRRNVCNYYHDPIKFVGSHDRRNFIASAWLYTPSSSKYRNSARSRCFGSRDNLDEDIDVMCADDIARFREQTMHDLLCALLLGGPRGQ